MDRRRDRSNADMDRSKISLIQEVLGRPLEGQNQPSVTVPGGARTPFYGPLARWMGKVSMSLERTGASDVCGF